MVVKFQLQIPLSICDTQIFTMFVFVQSEKNQKGVSYIAYMNNSFDFMYSDLPNME